MTMIKLSNVAFRYHKHAAPLHFDLQVLAGEKIAIVGASGAGKSTLLNLIAGFSIPTHGEVWLHGENYTHTPPHARPVSMLFQDNNLFNHLSIWQNIALGISPNLKLSEKQHQQVQQVAEQVGLDAYLTRLPDSLSGGQQQRVALARCLLRDKPILLLDEPFSALDKALRLEMSDLLDTLCIQKQLTLLLVTHQVEEITGFIHRTITVKP